jgi:cytochrome c oxidase subunit IV
MSETVIAKKTYLMAWAGLLLALAATIAVSYVNLGRLNIAVALIIASVKALIIGVYFMHLRYSQRLIWYYVIGAALWLTIMFTFTFTDYFARHLLAKPTVWSR